MECKHVPNTKKKPNERHTAKGKSPMKSRKAKAKPNETPKPKRKPNETSQAQTKFNDTYIQFEANLQESQLGIAFGLAMDVFSLWTLPCTYIVSKQNLVDVEMT